jgi:hypothetical protein
LAKARARYTAEEIHTCSGSGCTGQGKKENIGKEGSGNKGLAGHFKENEEAVVF